MPVSVIATPRSTAQISWRTADEQRFRIALRSHENAALECAGDRVRDERLGSDRVDDAAVLRIGDDADDLERRVLDRIAVRQLLHPLQDDLAANRILGGEILVHERLVDDGHLARRADFDRRQRAAPQNLQPERPEVAVAAELVNRLPSFRVGLAGNVDVGADAAVRRKRRRLGRRDDAGQRVQPRQQRFEKLLLRRRGLVLLARQRQARDQDVVRVEAEIDRLQLHEVAHQQPRAGQQHQRQRDFAHDKRASQLAAAEPADDAAARVLQRIGHVLLHRLQRRHQPEHDGREHRHAKAERQHGNVQPNVRLGGKQPLRHQALHALRCPRTRTHIPAPRRRARA